MKKIIASFLVGAILATSVSTMASTVKESISVTKNANTITVSGKPLKGDNFIYNDTTYVPIRAVSEALGADVNYNAQTKSTDISFDTSNATKEEAPKETPKPSTNNSNETLSQSNAVKSANDYLKFTSFSRKSLISQLEYEGYSNSDAIYAVDKVDVDWNEQAAQTAKDYLEISSFSRAGLISQLEYEGFTSTQIDYAIKAVGY